MNIGENIKKVQWILAFTLMVFSPYSYADEVEVPFPIYVEEFKEEAKASGLDLYDNRDSHGFIENKGARFVVFTYKPISQEHLELIKELTWKHIRMDRV